MLTEQDLIKMAMMPMQPIQAPTAIQEADPRTPVRKVYDAITHGAQVAGGAVASGIAGLNSLDVKGPVKTI